MLPQPEDEDVRDYKACNGQERGAGDPEAAVEQEQQQDDADDGEDWEIDLGIVTQ